MREKAGRYLHGELVVVIDCADLDRSAGFWAAALGYERPGPGSGTYLTLLPADGDGIEVLLQRVPEGKTQAKSRVHLDLRTRDLESEVARVVGLGAARLTAEPIDEDGMRWHVLADPDGNEFCVLQPLGEYWPT
jgi:predicted enzyme related to lactoylglutathione lyase